MLEQLLVEHGAPTLARLKVGNLIHAAAPDAEAFTEERLRLCRMLAPKGVTVTVLRQANGRALVYLFRPSALRKVLSCPRVQAFLRQAGYEALTPGAALATLRAHLRDHREFPHEIGVFLGYPLEDVTAFIAEGGQHCALCGCWKVYHNVHEAQRTFQRYDHCRAVYTRLFRSGWSMEKLTVAA